MSEASENVKVLDAVRKLDEVIRSVKNADADREDVVIELRDAERMRLEILANELASVIAEVPPSIDIFDFAISSGLKPRFWIDGVSHVSMGRDKRTYRFLKDTRNGRIILAESTDPTQVADQVTRYIAERLVERERLLVGGAPVSYRVDPASSVMGQAGGLDMEDVNPTAAAPAKQGADVPSTRRSGWKSFFWGVAIFLLGGLFGVALLSNYLWDRIANP
ncbi:MAG: hypothetical protein M9924_05060 [Rhizobiaceae bacterium]|nr:hypothetical protein [Rhizobiaceae bacterium]